MARDPGQRTFTGAFASIERRADEWLFDQRFKVYVGGLLVALLFLYLSPRMLVTVPAGSLGVLFRRFQGGTEIARTLQEGFHLMLPWDSITIYDARLQDGEVDYTVLTKDGLSVRVKVSIRYRPRVDRLGLLHKHVGPDYFKKIVEPEIQSGLRTQAGNFAAEALYSSERSLIERALDNAMEEVRQNYLVLENLLVKEVILPARVVEAIEAKARVEQASQSYRFHIALAEKERTRKQVEAEGVKRYNEVIASGLTESLLRWRGIEATVELARSNNAKLVIVGAGKTGLPLLLDGSMPAGAAPPALGATGSGPLGRAAPAALPAFTPPRPAVVRPPVLPSAGPPSGDADDAPAETAN